MHRGTHSSEQRRGEARAPADAQSVHLLRNQPSATGVRVLARCTRMPWHARVFQPCRPQFFGAVSMWWCPGRCASTHVLTEPRLVRLPAGIQANFPSLSLKLQMCGSGYMLDVCTCWRCFNYASPFVVGSVWNACPQSSPLSKESSRALTGLSRARTASA